MGVDIGTYRCRIGTFRHGPGLDVILLKVCINYNGCMKMVGAVAFIGILLLMAGVEANPGPLDKPISDRGEDDIRSFLNKLGLDNYATIFEENMIGVNEVKDMTNEDFRILGISMGNRIRIQKACKQHVEELDKKSHESDSDAIEDERKSDNNTGNAVNPSNAIAGISGVGLNTDVDKDIEQLKEERKQMQIHIDKEKLKTRDELHHQVEEVRRSIPGKSITDEERATSVSARPRQPPPIALKPKFRGLKHGLGFFNTRHGSKHVVGSERDSELGQLSTELTTNQDLRKSSRIDEPTTVDPYIEKRRGTKYETDILLNRLQLRKYFPGKIGVRDVTTIDLSEALGETNNPSELPWLLLKRIVMANSTARDHIMDELVSPGLQGTCTRTEIFCEDLNEEKHDDAQGFSPLDIFLVTFYCCDPMLKQYLFKKLFMCRLAVPFLYTGPNTQYSTLSVWPLRNIVVEWKNSENKSAEISILNHPTRFIVFARFGRPLFSKSKLMNDLLSGHMKHDTFYNKDCPFGMSDRTLSHGLVEASWFLPGENESYSFKEVLTFLNVRGDLVNYSNKQTQYFQTIANVFVLTLDVKLLRDSFSCILDILTPINCLILIVTNSDCVNENEVKDILHRLNAKFTQLPLKKLTVVLTFTKGKEKNAADMKKLIHNHIKGCLVNCNQTSKTISDIVLSQFDIKSDEETDDCMEGKKLAIALFSKINEISVPEKKWKETITPLQHKHWRQWSALKKNLQRSFSDIEDAERIRKKMHDIRMSQMKNMSTIMECFIHIIVSNVEYKNRILYFIEWLNFNFDAISRRVLPALRMQYNEAWKQLEKLKNVQASQSYKDREAKLVKELEKQLADASFGTEHLFREMGQIYEAANISKVDMSILNLPLLNEMSLSVAKLMSYGHPFELMDGDASNIPTDWIRSVLSHVQQVTGGGKILTLSVLGIQSSGKSTLLNTMFGLKFAVSAGRCTRGVYCQLIPIKQQTDLHFEHVLVIDSEGLRAPELREQKKDHDNELATFVTGLGDITLLNIKGENATEIHDILEITVHAFLRLKVANKILNLQQKCLFVHQNVAAINAHEKMKYGVQKLVEGLDEMTKEAACAENVHDITTFNQVIEFDGMKHVWYLPDLWQGDPPMAATNVGYSNKVRQLRLCIMKMALSDSSKSYKSMTDVIIHSEDLWKGILSEDFVFSFKNSLEIKAYLQLEKKYKQLTWVLESFVRKETQERANCGFNKCQSDSDVDCAFETISTGLLLDLHTQTSKLVKDLDNFFIGNDYKDITIIWKQNKMQSMAELSNKFNRWINKEIKQFAENRKVQILVTSSRAIHEEKLQAESIELAKNTKAKGLSKPEIEQKFEQIWGNFVKGVEPNVDYIDINQSIQASFLDELYSMLSMDKPILSKELENNMLLDNPQLYIDRLKGSFQMTHITKEDISVAKKYIQMAKEIVFGENLRVMRLVEELTDCMFYDIDCEIKQLMQRKREIGQMDISCILHIVERWIDVMSSEKKKHGFSMKPTFIAKLYVFVSCHAKRMFILHNKEYTETYGVHAQMQQYKAKVRLRFDSHLQNRKAEDTASTLFRNEIEAFVKETVADKLPLRVENALYNMLPVLKYHLIIDILSEMADSFEQFIHYIKTPKMFVDEWVLNKSTCYLFDESSKQYFDLALSELSIIMTDIRAGIRQANELCIKQMHTEDEEHKPTISDWVRSFTDALSTCHIAVERLRIVGKENVQDFINFKEYLDIEIPKIEKTVEDKFRSQTHSLKWGEIDPCQNVSDKLWGCKEKCPFCGEPCSKSTYHEAPVDHNCIQHRPSGINGDRDSKTKEVSLSSCNFDVQSNITHTCGVFNFACNTDKKENCIKRTHNYTDYRNFLPSWLIAPTSDMEDTSKYWMWIMHKYKTQLAEYYDYTISNMPESWGRITKEEAIESMKKVYAT